MTSITSLFNDVPVVDVDLGCPLCQECRHSYSGTFPNSTIGVIGEESFTDVRAMPPYCVGVEADARESLADNRIQVIDCQLAESWSLCLNAVQTPSSSTAKLKLPTLSYVLEVPLVLAGAAIEICRRRTVDVQ